MHISLKHVMSTRWIESC